ncbi:hypothetical protein GB931_17040 [Modestobacter sp. I12A-02628]|uniref:Uncharacterized protein n=1 Tax=Goekera deserti TaxID=2497753 RepID=A0A7K3WDW5_9ACTN|nr:hypothetical protein [Goekera deserti]MPQ99591.1 hypothetical protein [Goekera deserti]NDI46399.1 hypothetical protein [Goekera deserti]NEL54668.1 hypothetical protein [Goekera deserti]
MPTPDNTCPAACPSCGLDIPRSIVFPTVCTDCMMRAGARASTALRKAGRMGDARFLIDTDMLAIVGLPLGTEPLEDIAPVQTAPAVARHRARLLWMMGDQLADARGDLDDIRESLVEAGFLSEECSLSDGVWRAVEAATYWKRLYEEAAHD